MNTSWTVTLEEDENGDIVLPLPEEMIKQLGWLTDDILDFVLNENDQSIIVTNLTCNERNGMVV